LAITNALPERSRGPWQLRRCFNSIDGSAPASDRHLFFERDWQRAYWGPNYSKLQQLKKKYDPGGLFFVHHGVGSEEWSADGFTRLG
jgi:hypothetical protein